MVRPSVDATYAISKSDTFRAFKPTLPNSPLLVTADHKIKIDDAPIMSPGEVLLHVRTTGVFGYSDIRFWKAGRIGELEVLGDCILGHEAAGEVVAVDENVTNATVGG
ncbi:hypothetical protein POJ06DRAFT_266188 [Lipomyces tetrasporus]|uniref:Alcohol dehydrogenase-like N-terminal domain-containing protein n=1 Tax=Lipomyces tetrasporus TaxID=54092 RepID=A0AAD7QXS3_9ASCO|nr:uncharacterized protein POJ06DRAFT_266188 [Lipomyces tetrasporus]KAJ8103334.1 hypothetical protein POJ06DRAFT_266188 [Lipomyces tetrasporus]